MILIKLRVIKGVSNLHDLVRMAIKSCTIIRNGANLATKLFMITYSFIEFDVVKYVKLFLLLIRKRKLDIIECLVNLIDNVPKKCYNNA